MPTEYLYLKGKVKWARVYKPDEKYQKWGIDFYPDEKSLSLIRSSGLSIQEREDDDGIFYKLRRDVTKIIKKEIVEFKPPEVRIVENGEEKLFDKSIGNGSICTVKLQIYDSMKGKAHRLDKIRVEKLVEYNREDNPTVDGLPPF